MCWSITSRGLKSNVFARLTTELHCSAGSKDRSEIKHFTVSVRHRNKEPTFEPVRKVCTKERDATGKILVECDGVEVFAPPSTIGSAPGREAAEKRIVVVNFVGAAAAPSCKNMVDERMWANASTSSASLAGASASRSCKATPLCL